MDTEKKPKRPRIGAAPVGSSHMDSQHYEKVNYVSSEGNRQPSEGTTTYQPRPYQQRNDYPQQPYQQRTHTDYGSQQYSKLQSEATTDDRQSASESAPQQPYSNYRPHYDRQQNGYQQRQGGYYQQRQGGYYQQRQGGYYQQQGGYPRQQGGYQPRQGGYQQRPQGGYQPRQGGYQPRQQQGDYQPRHQGGHQPRQGGYQPRMQGGYQPRQGGYQPRQGGYPQRPQGGYQQRPQQGGYQQRQGGYPQRMQGPRQGFPQQRAQRFTPRPKQIEYTVDIPDPNSEMRLNKYMSNAGICSRREADEKIQAGVVSVNGQVVTELGTKIKPTDIVEYEGKVVVPERKCYVLLNKPKDCVTTSDDPGGRTTVLDIVKNACTERIYPVGRLDRNTTGVLLLTNDGDLASKLTHPKYVKKKIYHVWTDKDISEEDMQRIADGIELEDGEIHADEVSYVSDTDRKQAGLEIHSGRNRIVRRIFETLGYHVVKLDRVYFAGLTKKNLPRGKWRYLTQEEVNYLRQGSFE